MKHFLILQAVITGESDVVEFLINNGAEKDVSDMIGRTPLDYAIMLPNRNDDIISLLHN